MLPWMTLNPDSMLQLWNAFGILHNTNFLSIMNLI
jgi:hypothetical protein